MTTLSRGDALAAADFWSKVDRSNGPEACWTWKGYVRYDGYGQLQRDKKKVKAHRLALALSGAAFTSSDCVLHRCDNKLCVNPAHLSTGTQADNMRDMVSKGRSLGGERNARARLTSADVRGIRVALLAGEPKASIARRFRTSRPNVQLIAKGGSWANTLPPRPNPPEIEGVVDDA